MKTISYSVLQYRHDRAIGEAINVGVLSYSREDSRAAFECVANIGQLSKLYAEFDASGFRSALRRLGKYVVDVNQRSEGRLIPAFDIQLGSAYDLLLSLWPDQGSSLVGEPARFVATESLEKETKRLFERLVTLVRPESPDRNSRKDDDVWKSLMQGMDRLEGLAARFKPHSFENEVHLDYVAQRLNDLRYVAIEPLALDYVDELRVRDRTFEVAGKAVGLNKVSEFEKLYVVIGAVPRTKEVERAVQWSQDFLSNLDLKVDVLSESNREGIAKVLDMDALV